MRDITTVDLRYGSVILTLRLELPVALILFQLAQQRDPGSSTRACAAACCRREAGAARRSRRHRDVRAEAARHADHRPRSSAPTIVPVDDFTRPRPGRRSGSCRSSCRRARRHRRWRARRRLVDDTDEEQTALPAPRARRRLRRIAPRPQRRRRRVVVVVVAVGGGVAERSADADGRRARGAAAARESAAEKRAAGPPFDPSGARRSERRGPRARCSRRPTCAPRSSSRRRQSASAHTPSSTRRRASRARRPLSSRTRGSTVRVGRLGARGGGHRPSTLFWVDVAVVNQHVNADRDFDWWSSTFRQAVAKIGRTLLVLAPWRAPVR